MEPSPEGLLGGPQTWVARAACVFGEDRCASEPEEMVSLERLLDGGVHFAELTTVTLVEYENNVACEHRVALVLAYKS